MHCVTLLEPSVTVMVMACGPMPTCVPGGGLCVSVTPPQLSLAIDMGLKSGIAAWQFASAFADCGALHVSDGGVTSTIVNVVPQVVKRPTESVAVMVTLCGPTPVTVL